MPSVGEITAGINVDARRGIQQVNHFGQVWNAMASNVASGFVMGAGMGAFNATLGLIQQGFEAATNAAFTFNSRMEQSNIAFTTLLGSGEKASAFLQDLKQFALTTPFEFPNLVETGQSLVSMGFAAERIIPLITRIGNAASGLGKGQAGIDRITLALTQMQIKGKVSGQEILQLAESGIPGYKLLADAIGMTVPETIKLAEAGKISSDIFIAAFERFSDMRFGGLMAAQGRTMTTALSNVKDGFQQAAAQGLLPWFTHLRDGAVKVAEFLQTDRWNRWVRTFEHAMTVGVSLLERLERAAQGPLDALADLFDQFSDLAGIQTIERPAKAAGASAGNAFASGMSTALEAASPTEKLLNDLDKTITTMTIQSSREKFFQADITRSFEDQLRPLESQLRMMETQRDWSAEIAALQLEEEEATLRTLEARKRLNDEGQGTITSTGRFKRGRDTSTDMRLLDIAGQREAASFKQRWGDLSSEIVRAPIKAHIDSIKAAQEAALAPGEERIRQLEREGERLGINKSIMELMNKEIDKAEIKLRDAFSPHQGTGTQKTSAYPMSQGLPADTIADRFKKAGGEAMDGFLSGAGEWKDAKIVEWGNIGGGIAYDIGKGLGNQLPKTFDDLWDLGGGSDPFAKLGHDIASGFAQGFWDGMKQNFMMIGQDIIKLIGEDISKDLPQAVWDAFMKKSPSRFIAPNAPAAQAGAGAPTFPTIHLTVNANAAMSSIEKKELTDSITDGVYRGLARAAAEGPGW